MQQNNIEKEGEGVACLCCGYLTLDDPEHYSYLVCPVCYWEDDPACFRDENYAGGANPISLVEGRKNFKEFGACEKRFIKRVRPPREDEIPKHRGNKK